MQLNKDIIESEQELFRQSQKLDAELQNQAQRYADINGATETTKKAISETVDKIIEENKEKKDKINIFKDLNYELSDLIPQLSDIGKEIEENKDNFTTEEIDKYKKQLRDTFGDSSLIETFFNIFITLLEKSKKGLGDGEESLASLSSILKSFTDDTDKLASAYKTLNDGQTLSLDKIEELLTAYPQLNDALEVNNGMLTINKDAILEVMKAEEKAFKKRVEIWKQEAINVRESILNKLSAYGEEIKSINDVINARKKLAETYSGKRAGLGIVLNYYDNAIEELQNIEDRIKLLQTLGSTDLSKQVTYSGKSSTSKSTTSYESQIDSLREYQIAIQVLESEIKRYQSYAELTTSEQNRIEYLNKINDLTKQQQDKLHELNNELRNQRDSLGEWLEKQGMGVFDKLTGSFDRTTEGIAKYNRMSDEMKKEIDDAI